MLQIKFDQDRPSGLIVTAFESVDAGPALVYYKRTL